MADAILIRDGPVAVPLSYQVPLQGEMLPLSVRATLDGTNAGQPFYAVVQLISPSGRTMGNYITTPIAAGASADVTWFPGGELDDEATTAPTGGTISRISSPLATLSVAAPSGPTTSLDLSTTAVSAGSYGDSGHVGTFTVDANGRLTAASSVSISGGGSVVASDGWVPDANSYTFATASSFTVGASDLTAVYSKGTRIKLTQTTVKYFVVTSSTFGAGTTTVNISAGTDFTLANAAITLPFYSYVLNPQGWPGAFNFTPGSIVGWAATPTVSRATFTVVGTECLLDVRITGTSNSTGVTFNAAIAGATTADGLAQTVGGSVDVDNGSAQATPGRCTITSGTAGIVIARDWSGLGWTNANTKTIAVTGTYRI